MDDIKIICCALAVTAGTGHKIRGRNTIIFIYNCFGGTHSSSLASAIHLKKLPADRIPTTEEILGTDYFNKLNSKDRGKIIYRGTDEEGNKVFTIGRGTSKILIPCLKDLITLLHNEFKLTEKIIFSNMSPTVPFSMSVGGFFSRGLGIDFIGVPLLVLGAKKAYMQIVDIVNRTKEAAKVSDGPVLVLTNTHDNVKTK